MDLVLDVDTESVSVEDGMKVVRAAGGREWRAHEILVGAGRKPNVEGLGLEEIGVETGPGAWWSTASCAPP